MRRRSQTKRVGRKSKARNKTGKLSKVRKSYNRKKTYKKRRKVIIQNGGFTNPFGGMTNIIRDIPQTIQSTYKTFNPPPAPVASNPSTSVETSNPTKGHFDRIQESPNINDVTNIGKIYKQHI